MTEQVETERRMAEGQFRLHFFLANGSHEMDATVMHQCEGAVLELLGEIAKQLDVQLRIDTRAYGEGGIVVWLTFIGKHAVALTLIGGAATAICGGAVWLKYHSKLLEQQIEQNELILKKTRLELKNLEKESDPESQKAPATASTKSLPLEPPPKVEDVVPALMSSRRVIKLRSQFYERLIPYDRVDAVGFAATHNPNENEERVVTRGEFGSLVVRLAELDPEVIEGAEIEVVAPVLRRGAGKWRGVFQKHSISFDLEDEAFLMQVTGKKVKFQNGTTLVCNLKTQIRETETGLIEPYAHVVDKVHRYFNKPNIPRTIATVIEMDIGEPHSVLIPIEERQMVLAPPEG